jgi:hypothetical protein
MNQIFWSKALRFCYNVSHFHSIAMDRERRDNSRKVDLKMRSLASLAILCLTIGVGTAFAQTTTQAPMSQDQKKAISKSCSDQANAKGLHGTARKKFRSECKHHGGKPM